MIPPDGVSGEAWEADVVASSMQAMGRPWLGPLLAAPSPDATGRRRMMALIWQCDRCYRSSRDGNVDDPPPDGVIRAMPVRGSEGARSTESFTLCDSCDDRLYTWMQEPKQAENA